jgi:hypothetical protein
VPRKIRVDYPGAIYHVMSRGDRGEDIFIPLLGTEDRLLAYPGQRHKSDPGKWVIAARLRRETTLPVGRMATRLNLGTRKSASTRLQEWKRSDQTQCIHHTPANVIICPLLPSARLPSARLCA